MSGGYISIDRIIWVINNRLITSETNKDAVWSIEFWNVQHCIGALKQDDAVVLTFESAIDFDEKLENLQRQKGLHGTKETQTRETTVRENKVERDPNTIDMFDNTIDSSGDSNFFD